MGWQGLSLSCEACSRQSRGFLVGYPISWERRKGQGDGNTPSMNRGSMLKVKKGDKYIKFV
jgi:hypothetical protein